MKMMPKPLLSKSHLFSFPISIFIFFLFLLFIYYLFFLICHSEEQLSSNENEKGYSNNSSISDVKREIISLSLPALAGQAIDPIAQLMETAYIGRLGTLELASSGVSVVIFNIISKLFNIPLLSVATSFVAQDMANISSSHNANNPQRKQLSSVSTALLLALGIGIFEALALYFGSRMFLRLIGVAAVCIHLNSLFLSFSSLFVN